MEQRVIALNDIQTSYPGFVNCRTTIGDLTELKASIEANGLMTLPMVWETADENGEAIYVLVAGHRRLAAIKELIDEVDGFEEIYSEITCSVLVDDLDAALTLNLAENVQREDLNPADASDAVGRLIERLGSQEQVGKALGKSQSWVSGHLALYRQLCPQAKDALRKEQISLKQARELALLSKKGVPNEEAQVAALNKMLGRADAENKESKKKEPTNRSKADLMLLRKALVSDDELEIDDLHRDSMLTLIRWFLLELDDTEVLERVELDNDYKLTVVEEEVELAVPRSAGRPRLSEAEKAEREAEKLAEKVKAKQDKAAAKEAEKEAAKAKKEAEKQAKDAEKASKAADASEKLALKKAAQEERAAARAKKDLEGGAGDDEPKVPVRRAAVATSGKKLPK